MGVIVLCVGIILSVASCIIRVLCPSLFLREDYIDLLVSSDWIIVFCCGDDLIIEVKGGYLGGGCEWDDC